MRYPELTGSPRSRTTSDLPKSCSDGYFHVAHVRDVAVEPLDGVPFKGLVYLVDEATSAKSAESAQRAPLHDAESAPSSSTP